MFYYKIALPLHLLSLFLASVCTQTVHSTPQDSPGAVLIIGQTHDADISQSSGTIIAPQWVLTARSCLYLNATRIPKFLVFAGGTSYREYADRRLPPSAQLLSSYQSYIDTRYDLALLRTQGRFIPTDHVQIVPLFTYSPFEDRDKYYREHAIGCDITGFGSLSEDSSDTGPYRITDKNIRLYIPCRRPSGCKERYYTWHKQRVDYACSNPRAARDYPECAAMPGAGVICDGELYGVAHTIVSTLLDSHYQNPCVTPPVEENPCAKTTTYIVATTLMLKRRWLEETMWPEKFPHPFPGCDAFSGCVNWGGSLYILLVLVCLHDFICS